MEKKLIAPEVSAAARAMRQAGIDQSTPEQRKEVSRVALRTRWDNTPIEGRAEAASKAAKAITSEAATARAHKAWVTRRAKQAEIQS